MAMNFRERPDPGPDAAAHKTFVAWL